MFCCDPGLVSGVAVLHWNLDGIRKYESFEGSLAEVGEAADAFLDLNSPTRSEVVVERFVITPRTGELASPDWSLKVCGALEWLVWRRWEKPGDETVVYQSAGDAKRLCPNEVLRKADLWHRGGAGHARDAIRHGLYRYSVQYGIRDAWAGLE